MKKIRIGILGLGKIARKMGYTLQRMEAAGEPVCAYAAASRDLENAREFAKQYGFRKACSSYEELVQDPQVELIYIATPHVFHQEQAMLCLKHNKHILVEKPFTPNAAQARAVFETAKEKGLFAAEAMWTRLLPMVACVQKQLSDGAVGTVTGAELSIGFDSCQVPRMARPELAGGALLDVGVYALVCAELLLGEQCRIAGTKAVLTESGVDLESETCLEFAGGIQARIHTCMNRDIPNVLRVFGTKGVAQVDCIYNWTGLECTGPDGNLTQRIERPDQYSGYEYEVRAAAAAIRDGKLQMPGCTWADTLRILKRMDALRVAWGMRYPFE